MPAIAQVELGTGATGATDSWNDWGDDPETQAFEQTGFKSREEKQKEAIESLFEEMYGTFVFARVVVSWHHIASS